jgi:hypothetical protein
MSYYELFFFQTSFFKTVSWVKLLFYALTKEWRGVKLEKVVFTALPHLHLLSMHKSCFAKQIFKTAQLHRESCSWSYFLKLSYAKQVLILSAQPGKQQHTSQTPLLPNLYNIVSTTTTQYYQREPVVNSTSNRQLCKPLTSNRPIGTMLVI